MVTKIQAYSFTYNGFNLAILPASGNCESFMERLIQDDIISSDTSFRNLLEIF